jgi:hypothetical protein
VTCTLIGLGCAHGNVARISAPAGDCPTKADIQQLNSLIPIQQDPVAAITVDSMVKRFLDAAAYCRVAARRLR